MDENIDNARHDSLRALRLRALALAAVAAAAVFFLVVGLGARNLDLGDITKIHVISGCIIFAIGGLLHPNLNGLFITALLWAAFQYFVKNGLELPDDSLSLFLGLGVTRGDHQAITVGVFFAAFTYFLIARFHYIAVLDRDLWPDYDRYVLDHPDFFWWRRDIPSRRPAMPHANVTRRRDTVQGVTFFNGSADPRGVGLELSQPLVEDEFWGPRYGSSTYFFDDRPWGLYGGDDDRDSYDAIGSSSSTDDWP